MGPSTVSRYVTVGRDYAARRQPGRRHRAALTGAPRDLGRRKHGDPAVPVLPVREWPVRRARPGGRVAL